MSKLYYGPARLGSVRSRLKVAAHRFSEGSVDSERLGRRATWELRPLGQEVPGMSETVRFFSMPGTE
jgi:hypothetical protein